MLLTVLTATKILIYRIKPFLINQTILAIESVGAGSLQRNGFMSTAEFGDSLNPP